MTPRTRPPEARGQFAFSSIVYLYPCEQFTSTASVWFGQERVTCLSTTGKRPGDYTAVAKGTRVEIKGLRTQRLVDAFDELAILEIALPTGRVKAYAEWPQLQDVIER